MDLGVFCNALGIIEDDLQQVVITPFKFNDLIAVSTDYLYWIISHISLGY